MGKNKISSEIPNFQIKLNFMFRKFLKFSIFIFALITFFISLYLTKLSYSTSISCSIFDGCNNVLTSKYSKIFNIPISIFGAIYSAFLIILFYFENKKFLIPLTFLGASLALILLYLQIFIIKSICFYCTLVDLIFIIIFILILIYFKSLDKADN